MYNKIFTKILDSSVWLEPEPTRIVWLTCIAAMDEDGFCAFAAPANLAHRANVSLTTCMAALETLEGADENSSDPDNDGRRLERVPGGWMVLNARKYRDLITRAVSKEQNRNRVRKHREKQRARNADTITAPLPSVTCNASEAITEAITDTRSETDAEKRTLAHSRSDRFAEFWSAYPKKVGKGAAERAFRKINPSRPVLEQMLAAVLEQRQSEQWQRDRGQFIPHPATWLNQNRWQDEPMEPSPLGSDTLRHNLAAADEAVRLIEAAAERRTNGHD